MFHNQKGFTYPVTLCFLLLFSALLMIHLEQNISEKRMLIEMETILKQDYYFLSTAKTLERLLSSNEALPTTGTIEYVDGQANYLIKKVSESLWHIQIDLKTSVNNGKTVDAMGIGYYDLESQRIVKWIEKN